MNNKSIIAIIASAILALGMVGMAFVIKAGMDNNTFRGRTISSRGVATKIVQADRATGSFAISFDGATAAMVRESVNISCDSIKSFALSYGIPQEAIKIEPTSITIMHHYDNNGNPTDTYYNAVATVSFYVQNKDVLKLYQMDSERDKLIDMNVLLSSSDFNYSFSDNALTKIKPEMTTEATKNAREAAVQLAKDNDCHVGDIVSVSQGYFEVDGIEGRPDYEKSVRVVDYAEFYLK